MEKLGEGALYCVVDLAGGPDAESYPVQYLDAEPEDGFNMDEYKTTKLVLKRIDAGTFVMGDPSVPDNQPHVVTLTKAFYMGIFEVTQKQWTLVMKWNPSYFMHLGDWKRRPVEQVYYENIRGLKDEDGKAWPESASVDPHSFVGRLRARTGIDFDLPTEAQWEYACRAGTKTLYSFGDESVRADYMWHEGDLKEYATQPVGMKRPNGFGLYDMHGNVSECCLDWYGRELSKGVDPVGPTVPDVMRRVLRGGPTGQYWFEKGRVPGGCSSLRMVGINEYAEDEDEDDGYYWSGPAEPYYDIGFRLAKTIG